VAATRMRSVAGIRSWPIDARATSAVIDGIRAALGDDVVTRALSTQQALPADELTQAIRRALGYSLCA